MVTDSHKKVSHIGKKMQLSGLLKQEKPSVWKIHGGNYMHQI